MSSHKGKSVKTLINERVLGKQYLRISAIAASSAGTSIQGSINVVLQSFLDSKLGLKTTMRKPLPERAKPVQRPQIPDVKYQTPTLLQRLNPVGNRLKEEGILDQAIDEVSELKTQIFTESVSSDLVQDPRSLAIKPTVNVSAAKQVAFTRTPKTIANLLR